LAEYPVQEPQRIVPVLGGEEKPSTMRSAVDYIKLDVEAGPLVDAVHFVRLVDGHLLVLIAMEK
jgi:hypothetical protein